LLIAATTAPDTWDASWHAYGPPGRDEPPRLGGAGWTREAF
jgi:hypothetical protein